MTTQIINVINVTTENKQKLDAVKQVTELDVRGYTIDTKVEQPVQISVPSLVYLKSIIGEKELTIVRAEDVCAKRIDMLQNEIGKDKTILSLENGIRVYGLEFYQLPTAFQDNKLLRKELVGQDDLGKYHLVVDYTCVILREKNKPDMLRLGSYGCIFPFEAFLEASRQEGDFATTTVGSILGRQKGVDPKNPHKNLPCYNMERMILPSEDRMFYLKEAIRSVWNVYESLDILTN